MKIRLPGVEEFEAENPPENLRELVIKSFSEYSLLTGAKYLYEDKLRYIDNLRTDYIQTGAPKDIEEAIKQYAYESVDSWVENENPLSSDLTVSLDTESMIFVCEKLLDQNLAQRLGKHDPEQINATIAEICLHVLNYNKEGKSDED